MTPRDKHDVVGDFTSTLFVTLGLQPARKMLFKNALFGRHIHTATTVTDLWPIHSSYGNTFNGL